MTVNQWLRRLNKACLQGGYKLDGLEAGILQGSIRARRHAGAGERPPVFFAIKSSGGVDRGRHLARLKLEILEFFGFQNRDYFGGPPPPEWLRIRVPEGAGNY